MWALTIQPKIPEISVGTSNGTDHFGLVRLEYLGLALKVVHFDRSDHFGWSEGNVPLHFTKLLFPVLLFWILLTENNNQTLRGLDRVCAPGMYRSTGHVKFPKFQTGIFVEWNAPCDLLQACEAHVLYTTFLCIKKPVLGKTKTTVL